jgi:hypothetical protein
VLFFKRGKDGGPDSNVFGLYIIEIKWLFSIVLLRFDGESREAFHTHAFNSMAWLLKGQLREKMKDGREFIYRPSLWPFFITRRDYHKVSSDTPSSWVLNFRGPWKKEWLDHDQKTGVTSILRNGRSVADSYSEEIRPSTDRSRLEKENSRLSSELLECKEALSEKSGMYLDAVDWLKVGISGYPAVLLNQLRRERFPNPASSDFPRLKEFAKTLSASDVATWPDYARADLKAFVESE